MHFLDIPVRKVDDEQRLVSGWANVPVPGVVAKAFDGAASLEDYTRAVAAAYRAQFPVRYGEGGETYEYRWIVGTFPTFVIAGVESAEGQEFYQHAYVVEGESIVFGPGVEVEQVWVEKALADSALSDPEAVTAATRASLGKQMLKDALAEAAASKVDLQGDAIPLSELEKAAYGFVEQSRKGSVDHTGAHVSDLVESFFATREKYEKMGVPADVAATLHQGWWVTFRVHDDEVWKAVKDGTLQMFSIGGTATTTTLDDA